MSDYDMRKRPIKRLNALRRTLEKQKDGLIACLEIAEIARANIASVESEIAELDGYVQ